MSDSLSILSWNVNGETSVPESQLEAQLEFIEEYCSDVDVFLLQAVRNQGATDESWDDHLASLLEFFNSTLNYHAVHTGDWSRELFDSDVQPHADLTGIHNRCNLTASRWPLERRPLTLRNVGNRKPRKLNYYYSHFPEKILVADIDTSGDPAIGVDRIESWNVGIVNGASWGEEKVNMLETVYGRIYLQNVKMDHPVLLGGDFNAPKMETDAREIVPHSGPDYDGYPGYGDPSHVGEDIGETRQHTFGQRWSRAEKQLFDSEVSDWNMCDAYLSLPESEYEPSVEDHTHVIHNGNPQKKRLDHVLVSDNFEVAGCRILNGRDGKPNGFRGDSYRSDHAPVVADVTLSRGSA